MPEIPRSADQLREALADALGVPSDSLGPNDDLIEAGLDSVTLMTLAGRWQRQGLSVTVAEFAEQPTLAAWWSRIDQAVGASE